MFRSAQVCWGDWSLSPDGLTIASANHDPAHPSIQLLPLPASKSSAAKISAAALPATIAVPGYGTVLGPSWDAAGTGFFVSANSAAGYSLLHVDLKGTVTLLERSRAPIWGVPSRDGTKLAFPASTPGNTNIWVGTIH